MNFAATMCENGSMRRRLLFAIVAALSAAGGFVACGLDENGQASDGGMDATSDVVNDVPLDVPADVPQACSTLDASACVPLGLPDGGWTYALVAPSDTACPAGVFKARTVYATNPTFEAGACSCGCTTSGSYSCAGTLTLSYMTGGCNKTETFDAGDEAGCFDTNQDPNIAISSLPSVSGTVVCDASTTTGAAYNAGAATACTPDCTVDYCGSTGAFHRCVVAPGASLACPSPFTVNAGPVMGSSVMASCGACGCIVGTPAACGATIQAYKNTACDMLLGTVSSTCTGESAQVKSIYYTPSVPDASCSAASNALGTIGVTQPVTVCCLPP